MSEGSSTTKLIITAALLVGGGLVVYRLYQNAKAKESGQKTQFVKVGIASGKPTRAL